MRREKDVRDHREALRRKAAALREHKRNKARKNMRGEYNKRVNRAKKIAEKAKQVGAVANKEFSIAPFKSFDNYVYSKSKVKVCHLIDSLGMGGGQTMTMELVGALNRYYGDHIENKIVCARTNPSKWDKTFYQSYGVEPAVMRDKDLSKYLKKEKFNIVLHHRLAISKCMRPYIPDKMKYILLNHTYHQLSRMSSFLKCDLYISVCNYLHKNTNFPSFIHPSRMMVILNGVENDYLDKLPNANLEGSFKTGRCHRMVQTKFKIDSLTWLEKKASKQIEGLSHYLIGHCPEAKRTCKKMTTCNYVGAINKRGKKMSIIKGLDLYFYETFQNEGASIAILESLACGVPVICKNFGGNIELVINGHNGFIVKTREDFLLRMKDLAENPKKLQLIKDRTLDDFNSRLHIKHTAVKYMQIFEALV